MPSPKFPSKVDLSENQNGYLYVVGNEATEGSWRIIYLPEQDAVVTEKRVHGIWTYKSNVGNSISTDRFIAVTPGDSSSRPVDGFFWKEGINLFGEESSQLIQLARRGYTPGANVFSDDIKKTVMLSSSEENLTSAYPEGETTLMSSLVSGDINTTPILGVTPTTTYNGSQLLHYTLGQWALPEAYRVKSFQISSHYWTGPIRLTFTDTADSSVIFETSEKHKHHSLCDAYASGDITVLPGWTQDEMFSYPVTIPAYFAAGKEMRIDLYAPHDSQISGIDAVLQKLVEYPIASQKWVNTYRVVDTSTADTVIKDNENILISYLDSDLELTLHENVAKFTVRDLGEFIAPRTVKIIMSSTVSLTLNSKYDYVTVFKTGESWAYYDHRIQASFTISNVPDHALIGG